MNSVAPSPTATVLRKPMAVAPLMLFRILRRGPVGRGRASPLGQRKLCPEARERDGEAATQPRLNAGGLNDGPAKCVGHEPIGDKDRESHRHEYAAQG